MTTFPLDPNLPKPDPLDPIRERIERGAAWLDSTVPGWRERLNLPELAMHNPRRCVLGQLFGQTYPEHETPDYGLSTGYAIAIERYGDAAPEDWARDLGFEVDTESYDVLEDAWWLFLTGDERPAGYDDMDGVW